MEEACHDHQFCAHMHPVLSTGIAFDTYRLSIMIKA